MLRHRVRRCRHLPRGTDVDKPIECRYFVFRAHDDAPDDAPDDGQDTSKASHRGALGLAAAWQELTLTRCHHAYGGAHVLTLVAFNDGATSHRA